MKEDSTSQNLKANGTKLTHLPAFSISSGWPDFLAESIGVSPLAFVARRSALCCNKQLKHLAFPCSVARCDGVL